MIFRPYRKEDASEIIKWIKNERELRLWSADRYGDYPINEDDINLNYESSSQLYSFYPFTLEEDGRVVGHLIMRVPGNDNRVIRFGFIIVDNSVRGKGYGKKLINEAIKYAKDVLQVDEINLGVFHINNSAFNCYKAVGFEVVHIDIDVFKYNDESWNCVEMVLKR